MIPRVVEVKALADYRLWVRFHDGTAGTVDLSPSYGVPCSSRYAIRPYLHASRCTRSFTPSRGQMAPIYPPSIYIKPPNHPLQRTRRKRRAAERRRWASEEQLERSSQI